MAVNNMSKKATIVFGGAFNPPTLAHQAILQACIDYAETIDADVWVMPCGNRVHKIIDVPSKTRLKYVNALIDDVSKRDVHVSVESRELYIGKMNETYDTAKALRDRHPNRRFVWVFGADSIATIESWKRGVWLKKNLSMLIVNRPGVDPAELTENMALLDIETDDISSTQVRALLAANEPVDHLVTPSVLDHLLIQ